MKFLIKLLTTILLFAFPTTRRTIRRLLTNDEAYTPPWYMLTVMKRIVAYFFRRRSHFKYYISLTLCVKNESAYILEWLEYHLHQGVDHFYIYNNNGTDNTGEYIERYIQEGVVTWIDYPGEGKQIEIYNHAIDHFKNETRWMGFIDVDEFIVPHNAVKLSDFMQGFEHYSQLVIRWVLYGSSGLQYKEKGLVIERFRAHQKGCQTTSKAIMNPRAVLWAHVHSSYVMGDTVAENKKKMALKDSDDVSTELIQINHYAVKSWEEYLLKKKRGDVMVGKLVDWYFDRLDRNEEYDTPSVMGQYAKQVRLALEEKRLLDHAL